MGHIRLDAISSNSALTLAVEGLAGIKMMWDENSSQPFRSLDESWQMSAVSRS
jgi:hypothetical protein